MNLNIEDDEQKVLHLFNDDIVYRNDNSIDTIEKHDTAIKAYKNPMNGSLYQAEFEAVGHEELTVGIASIYNKLDIDLEQPMLLGTMYLNNINRRLFYKGNIFPLMTSEQALRRVLIIGIGTNPNIRKQWDSVISPMDYAGSKRSPLSMLTMPALNSFNFVNKDGKEKLISPAIKSDFLRAIVLEDMFNPCKVYTVTICKDEVRNAEYLGPDALNYDINWKTFLTAVREKKWKIDQIFVDHYRNSNPYLVEMLGKQFFRHLKELGSSPDDILNANAISESGKAEVFLPFAPYTVSCVIEHQLRAEYNVEYVSISDLENINLNLLHSASNSINHKNLLEHFNIQDEHNGKIMDDKYSI